MKRRLLLAGALALLFSLTVFSQDKTVVIVGSSTAEGRGASLPARSYVGRLKSEFSKNKTDGIDTTVIALAVAGYTTYKAMPDDFVMPSNRSDVTIDRNNNITKALSYNPDVVIINFPSNDQDPKYGYSLSETMNNLRLMFSRVEQTGANCFITTSQPRNQYDDPHRKLLKDLADSVENAFGDYALDFWDVLVENDNKFDLKDIVNFDDIHVNDLGHELLFETILAKNIFAPMGALPVKLTAFNARLSGQVVEVKWQVELEEPATFYEIERSANGTDFSTVARVKGTANPDQRMEYAWIDPAPLNGKNIYRLKIIEPDGSRYSHTVNCNNGANPEGWVIGKAYAGRNELVIELVKEVAKQPVAVRIFDQSGQLMAVRQYQPGNDAQLRIPFTDRPAGLYIIQALTADGRTSVKRLVKAY